MHLALLSVVPGGFLERDGELRMVNDHIPVRFEFESFRLIRRAAEPRDVQFLRFVDESLSLDLVQSHEKFKG